MVQDVLQFALQKLDEGTPVALLTVTDTHGSSPATPGQMMAVLPDGGTCGTVGGGASEHRLAQQAVQALRDGTPSFSFSFDHSEAGMVCGGGMSGYGTVLGAGPGLIIFGGGHVAQQVAALAAHVGFGVTVVEDRPELAENFEDARYVLASPEAYAEKLHLDENTYVLICTRGHRTDDDALRFCLGQPLRYLGMIGSKKKVITLFSELRRQGVSEEILAKIYAPVGLDVASGVPAEIAVAVVAEMLLVKNNGTAAHKRDII